MRGVLVFLVLCLSTTAAYPQCCGDCDGNGAVVVNELVRAVNGALEGCAAPPTDRCDGAVSGTPKLCNLRFEPNSIPRMAGTTLRWHWSDADGDISWLCFASSETGQDGKEIDAPFECVWRPAIETDPWRILPGWVYAPGITLPQPTWGVPLDASAGTDQFGVAHAGYITIKMYVVDILGRASQEVRARLCVNRDC